ncbi:MAG: hypothetical protein AAB664_01005 [Patescibacteria group bacterium]
MTKRLVLISASAVLAISVLLSGLVTITSSAHAGLLTTLANLKSGDLVRGESYSAVYFYGADGFRYVFPNDKTYFTWYQNFDSVKWVSDADLSKIQIGGNITYKPGVRMIKINSDPRVYVVSKGGTIRAIASENVASALYGATWNKMIDDVPDGFFSNYKMGGKIDDASMFSVNGEKSDAANIGVDKTLQAPTVISLTDSGYSPTNVTIKVGTVVKFMNNGSAKHTASDDAGDWGTGTLNGGDNFSRYFKLPGTYHFHDAYGASKGTINVQ